jgi:hypothetical protein
LDCSQQHVRAGKFLNMLFKDVQIASGELTVKSAA